MTRTRLQTTHTHLGHPVYICWTIVVVYRSVSQSLLRSFSTHNGDLNLALKSPHCWRPFFWPFFLVYRRPAIRPMTPASSGRAAFSTKKPPIQKSHFCRQKAPRDAKSAISVADDIRLKASFVPPLKILSVPIIWLVAAARSNCKRSVFSLDNSRLKTYNRTDNNA